MCSMLLLLSSEVGLINIPILQKRSSTSLVSERWKHLPKNLQFSVFIFSTGVKCTHIKFVVLTTSGVQYGAAAASMTLVAELSPAGRTEVASRCCSPAQGARHPAGPLSDSDHSDHLGYGDSRGLGFLGFYFTHHVFS